MSGISQQGHSARSGSGIAASIDNGAAFTIEDSALRDNRAVRANDSGGVGGGLWIRGTSGLPYGSVVIDNTTFDGNDAIYGGGFYQDLGTTSIIDSRFTDNVAEHPTIVGRGGAIYFQGDSITLESSELSHNAGPHGGAVYVRDGSLDLIDSTIENNEATTAGGGVYSLNAVLNVTGSVVYGNTSAGAAGGMYADSSTLNMSDSGVIANESLATGGGVYSTSSIVNLVNSEFKHNRAGSSGGGLYIYGSTSQFAGTAFVGNVSAAAGGGVYTNSGTLEADDSTFAENEANIGGGIYASVNDGDSVSIENNTFSENYARETGGGLCVGGEATPTSGVVTILNSTIDANRAKRAGGIYMMPGTLSIAGTAITNNQVNLGGGGLYIFGSGNSIASVTNSTISGNTANIGGGVYIPGGLAEVTIVNSTIADNLATSTTTAIGAAGGIRNTASSTVTLYNTIVAGNHADNPAYPDVQGEFDASSSYNLIGYDPITSNGLDHQPASGSHNQVGGQGGAPAIDARLAPLGNYGGMTLTHALLADSPAIDKGYNGNIPSGVTTDERGFDRTINFTGAGEIVDVGAVEQAPESRLLADFNGDGRLDSAAYDSLTRNLVVSLNTEDGIRTSVWGTLATGAWADFAAGDFNGDGRSDVIARKVADNSLVLAVSEGNQFQVLSVVDAVNGSAILAPWTEMHVGDFDGDGADELVGREDYQATWKVLQYEERAGATLETGWGGSLRSLGWTTPILVGDANRDGRDDLLVRNSAGWYVSLSQPSAGSSGQFLPILSAEDSWGDWFDDHYDPVGETVDVDGPYQDFLDIFSEIYNAIELEFYPGLMKGIQATAETKAGNPWDQAALLVDRLEAAGFEADIASGQVRVPFAAAQQWAGTMSPSAAYAVIKSMLDGNATTVGSDIQFKHVWIQAQAPTASGFEWVDLDPSWKFRDRQPGVDLSGLTSPQGNFDEFAYLAPDGDRLPIEFFEDQVMQYLDDENMNASLADVPHDGPIVQKQFSEFPVGLAEGVTTVGTAETFENLAEILGSSTLKDRFVHQATVSLSRELVSEARALPLAVPGDDGDELASSDFDSPGNRSIDVTAAPMSYTINDGGPADNGATSVPQAGVRRLAGTKHLAIPIPSGYSITPNTRLQVTYSSSSNAVGHDLVVGWDQDSDWDVDSGDRVASIPISSSPQPVVLLPSGSGSSGFTATSVVLGLRHSSHTSGSTLSTNTWAEFSQVKLYEASTGTAIVLDLSGGKTIRQEGDHYLSLSTAGLEYEVTANTMLEVEFNSSSVGTLHAIGWDVDDTSDNDATQPSSRFRLAGSSTIYPLLSPVETLADSYKRYLVPIGAALGSAQSALLGRLIVYTDGTPATESLFRNLNLTTDIGDDGEHWSSPPLTIPEHSLSAIVVDYVKSDNAAGTLDDDTYRSRLLINGNVVAEGLSNTALQLGDKAKMRIQHQSPSEFGIGVSANAADKTYTRGPGQILAIGFDANQYSREHIIGLQAALNELLLNGGDVSDIDELLSYTAAKYWYDFNRSNEIIDGLLHTVGGQQWVGSGIVTADPFLLEIPDEAVAHLQFPIVPHDMGVDLPNSTHASFDVDSGATDAEAFQLTGYNASALENAILEEVVNSASISTIRGLQRAFEGTIGETEGTPITYEAIQVFESAMVGSNRVVYFRGEIGDDAQVTYNPASTSTRNRTQLLTTDNGGLKHHVNEASRIADLLFQENGQTGAVGTIRVLVPRSRSQLGDPADGWTGTVYVAEYETTNGQRGSYIISPDDGTPTSGGYSSNLVKERNQALPPINFTNYASSGDPVNVANGNMFRDEADFRFTNRTMPLDFARHYDSHNNMDVGVGVGWVHSFTGVLYRDPESADDNKIIWLRDDGQRYTFERADASSEYEVPASLSGTFETIRNGSSITGYIYREKDGTQYRFDAASFDDSGIDGHVVGRVVWMGNRADDGLIIAYENSTSLRVLLALNAYGSDRLVVFQYDDSADTVRVQRFEDGQLLSTWTYGLTEIDGGPGHTDRRLQYVMSDTDEFLTEPAFTVYEYYENGPEARIGLIRRIFEPGFERWHEYEYYANGRVFRVTDSAGCRQSFSYNLFRSLTEFTDERGSVETYLHQDNGLMERQVHPDRSRLTFTWGAEDSHEEFLMKSSTDEVGATETFAYYQPGELHTYRSSNQDVYRPGELKQSVSKDGIITEYQYWVSPDLDFRHVSELSKIIVDPGEAAITTDFAQRDDRGMLERVIDAEGNVTEREYYGYDVGSTPAQLLGRLKSETQPKGVQGDEAVTWQPIVDSFTISGDTLTVRLLGSDVSTEQVVADAIRIDRIDADGVFTGIIDDDRFGGDPHFRLETFGSFWESSNGTIPEYGGDATVIGGSTPQGSATWIFTDLEPGTYRISATWVHFSQRDATTAYDIFDGLPDGTPSMQLTDVDQRLAPVGFGSYQTVYEYDAAGNVVAAVTESLPAGWRVFDSNGNVLYEEDATGVATVYEYDILDRLTRSYVTDPTRVNFNERTPVPYLGSGGGQDASGGADIQDGGQTLYIYGNSWKTIGLGYEITPNTVLEFDFQAAAEGEAQGLAFAHGNTSATTPVASIRLLGTQAPGATAITDYDYDIAYGKQHYRIPFGQYGTLLPAGLYEHLVFMNDDDGDAPANGAGQGESYYSNIVFYESDGVGETTFTYDASGLLLSSTDALGRTTTNQYDGKGNLIKQTYADGTSVAYEYDGVGNRILATDQLGRATRFIYDIRNRLIQTVFADGSSTSTRYDGTDRVVASTDELGRTAELTYDKAGRILSTQRRLEYDGLPPAILTETNTYDSLGRLSNHVDANGNETVYKHDSLGRVVETRVLDDGDPGVPPVYLSTTRYDAHGNLAEQVVYDVVGLVDVGVSDFSDPTSLIDSYGAHVHVVETRYDAFNRPVEVTNADGTATSNIYDAAGRVRYAIDELGHRTGLQYDPFGRLERTVAPDPDGLGPQESAATRYERDAFGNVIRAWEYFGLYDGETGVEFADRYVYDARNRVVTVFERHDEHRTDSLFDVAGQLVAATDALGNTSYTRYDERGRVIQQRLPDPDGSGKQFAPVMTYEYDAAGNVVMATDPLGNTTWFAYDSLNRLRDESRYDTVIADDSNTPGDTTFSASANAATVQIETLPVFGRDLTYWSPGGSPEATWTFSGLEPGTYRVSMTWFAAAGYDADATAQILVNGSQASGTTLVTVNQEQRPNDVLAVHGQHTIGWEVLADSVTVSTGQTLAVRLAGSGGGSLIADAVRVDRIVSRQYAYDDNGNLVAEADTLGRASFYTYDGLGRQTSATLPDPDVAGSGLIAPKTESYYDGYGNLIRTIELRGGAPFDRTSEYEYDQRNRLTKETIDSGDANHENVMTGYEYDAVGNTTLVTDALGYETHYRYDAADRLIDQYQDFGEGGGAAAPLVLDDATFVSPYSTAYDGVYETSPDGLTVTVTGDVWTFAPIGSYLVTHQTVLEIELHIASLPDHLSIGFDTNTAFDAGDESRYFQLAGPETWDDYFHTDFREEALPSDTIRVHVPIGQYLSEDEIRSGIEIQYLVFFSYGAGSESEEALSTFSNIRLYESDEVRSVYTYDTRGNLETARTASDPRGITTRYHYDPLGRQTHEVLDFGGPAERTYVTVYDAVGNVVAERNQSAGTETTYQYDDLYRRIKTTLPDPDDDPATPNGLVTTYGYDVAGHQIKRTNGESESTYSDYNELGLAIATWDGNGDETRYRYDSEGNTRSVTDAEQNTTTYQYDNLNRLTLDTNALGDSRVYFYNNQGNLDEAIDRNGRVRGFVHDTLDRLDTEVWIDGEYVVHVIKWDYDKLGRVTRQEDDFDAGIVDNVDTFDYDGLGRLVERRNYDPTELPSIDRPEIRQTYEYAFAYDAASDSFRDQVTRMQYTRDDVEGDEPVAQTLFEYDRLGQLEFESDRDADAASGPDVAAKQVSFRYDRAGNLNRITRQSGELDGGWALQATTALQYDDTDRLEVIDHQFAPYTAYSYAYDNASRITQFNTLMGAATVDGRGFQYDNAGQLTQTTGDADEWYAYDASGNRTTAGGRVGHAGVPACGRQCDGQSHHRL